MENFQNESIQKWALHCCIDETRGESRAVERKHKEEMEEDILDGLEDLGYIA